MDVVANEPRRWRLPLVLLAAVVIVAAAVGVIVTTMRDDGAPADSPNAAATLADPLTIGHRFGVSTDRDHDRFTYAFTVRNSTRHDVTVTGIELVPADGLTVVLSSVVTLAEFQQVWDPAFVPPPKDGRERLRPGIEAALLVRIGVDCDALPTVRAVRVHLRQGRSETQQDIPAAATNDGDADLDLRTLPSRSCA